MKKIVRNILLTGVTKSKKSLREFVPYCDILKYLLKEDKDGRVVLKENYFWSYENRGNREMFAYLLTNARKKSISDTFYFQILNRMSNGDKFGIETDGEW